MTHDEYNNLLAKMIAEPDSAPDTAKSILEAIDNDTTMSKEATDKATADYADLEAKYKDIEKKYNAERAKNFLGERGNVNQEKTLDETVDDIIKSIINPKKEDK